MSLSSRRNPFDDDEVPSGLMSASEDHEQEVEHKVDEQLIPYEVPMLTRGQRIIGSVVRYMDPSQTVAIGATIMRNAQLEGFDTPSAVKYLITSGVWVVMKEGMEGVNAMARLEQPFRYHLALGGGRFAPGLLRDIKRKAMVAAPIMGVLVGLGFGRDAIYNWTMQNPESRNFIMLGLFYLDGPVLRTFLVGLLTMIAYEKGQQLVNYCSPLPDVPLEVNPQTRWFQKALQGGMRVYYSVIGGEFLRETCNTVIGFTYLFQTRISLMAGPYYEFGLRNPAAYVSTEPHPYEKLETPCAPSTVQVEDEDGVPLRRVVPSKARQAAGVSTRIAIVLMILGGATVANNFIAPQFGDTEEQKNLGPGAWSMGGRMGYVAVMSGACVFLYGASMLLPDCIRQVGRRCFGLFGGGQQNQPGVPMQEMGQTRRQAL